MSNLEQRANDLEKQVTNLLHELNQLKTQKQPKNYPKAPPNTPEKRPQDNISGISVINKF